MTKTARHATLTSASLWPISESASHSFRIALLSALSLFAITTVGCNMNSSKVSNTQPPPPPVTPSAPNELPITVSAGPGSSSAVNRPYASVTICVPGTSNCQTIDNVLVDEGSTGLRIFSSVVTLPLAPQPAPFGATYECFPLTNNYAWGPVVTADIHLSGESSWETRPFPLPLPAPTVSWPTQHPSRPDSTEFWVCGGLATAAFPAWLAAPTTTGAVRHRPANLIWRGRRNRFRIRFRCSRLIITEWFLICRASLPQVR